MEDTIFKKFETIGNYTVLTALITKTITSMGRFKSIPRSAIISKAYSDLKNQAAK